ncbi:hypothetical protein JCM33774_76620 [Actinophytocola sp. KF-1]
MRKRRTDPATIVDGALAPTRDHRGSDTVANYRYSTNVQVVIDADTRLVVATGNPQPGNRNDRTVHCESGIGQQPAGDRHLRKKPTGREVLGSRLTSKNSVLPAPRYVTSAPTRSPGATRHASLPVGADNSGSSRGSVDNWCGCGQSAVRVLCCEALQ